MAERTYHNKVRRTILTAAALSLGHSFVSSCSIIFLSSLSVHYSCS